MAVDAASSPTGETAEARMHRQMRTPMHAVGTLQRKERPGTSESTVYRHQLRKTLVIPRTILTLAPA